MKSVKTLLNELQEKKQGLIAQIAAIDEQIAACETVSELLNDDPPQPRQSQQPPADPPKAKQTGTRQRSTLQTDVLRVLSGSKVAMSPIAIRKVLEEEDGYEWSGNAIHVAIAVLVNKKKIRRMAKGQYLAGPAPDAASAGARASVWVPQLPKALSIIRDSNQPIHINQLATHLNIKGPAIDALLGDLAAKAAAGDQIKRIDPNTFARIN